MTNPRLISDDDAARVRALGLVRIALLLGILLFGALTYVVHRQSAPLPPTPGALAPVRLMVMIVMAAALVGALVMRVQIARVRDAARRAPLQIITWAMGEAAALAGGVYYFVAGEPRWYLIGVLVLLASLVVVPLRPDL